MRAILRISSALVYGAVAAIGIALVSRPALLWVRSLGLLHTASPWDVPAGPAYAALGIALVASITALCVATAFGHRFRRRHQASLLALASAAFIVRASSPEPQPPPDPNPALLAALRTAADRLDALWAGTYAPDPAAIDASLAATGFRRFGRPVPVHVRVLPAAEGPQLDALRGDEPGTIYVAVSKDRGAAWLTALGLHGFAQVASGRPGVIEARAGTHSAPDADPMVPSYPRARSAR